MVFPPLREDHTAEQRKTPGHKLSCFGKPKKRKKPPETLTDQQARPKSKMVKNGNRTAKNRGTPET